MRSDADYARLAERAKAEREAERARLDRELASTFARMRGAAPKASLGSMVPSGKMYRVWEHLDNQGYRALDVDEKGYHMGAYLGPTWRACSETTADYLSKLTPEDAAAYRELDGGSDFDAIVASFEAWQAKQGG